MLYLNDVTSYYRQLYHSLKIISILLLFVVIISIIIIALIRKAQKDDPSGNTKRKIIYKTIATAVGIVITVIGYLLPFTDDGNMIMIYNEFATVIITITACIYGPVAGFFMFFLGHLFGLSLLFKIFDVELFFRTMVFLKDSYFCIHLGVYGFIVGFSWKKCISDTHTGKKRTKNLMLFCLIQIISNFILCFVLRYMPNMSLLYDHRFVVFGQITIETLGTIVFYFIKTKRKKVSCTAVK